jgi:hypothetical protein
VLGSILQIVVATWLWLAAMDGWMDGSTLFKNTLIFSEQMLVSKRGVYYYDRIENDKIC